MPFLFLKILLRFFIDAPKNTKQNINIVDHILMFSVKFGLLQTMDKNKLIFCRHANCSTSRWRCFDTWISAPWKEMSSSTSFYYRSLLLENARSVYFASMNSGLRGSIWIQIGTFIFLSNKLKTGSSWDAQSKILSHRLPRLLAFSGSKSAAILVLIMPDR